MILVLSLVTNTFNNRYLSLVLSDKQEKKAFLVSLNFTIPDIISLNDKLVLLVYQIAIVISVFLRIKMDSGYKYCLKRSLH